MIYLVNKANNEILNRCDAWEMGGEERLRKWAYENGFVPLDSEITFMGDMVIWAI